jgi:lipopolysaccharide biosynthesis glycosyltransferase
MADRVRTEIPIVVALDANVLWGCAVTVRSAIERSRAGTAFRVFVLQEGLGAEQEEALRSSWEVPGHDVNVRFIPVGMGDVKVLVRSRTLSRMSYARLRIAEVVPADIHRCLYLDTDLLFERDICELFETDLGDRIVAAVPDGGEDWDREQFARLGVRGERYFNAGLLLIDLERWRAAEIGRRAAEFCERARPRLAGPFRFTFFGHDQDGLNYALAGQVRYLPTHWNTWAVRRSDPAPAVVHLITGPKPWDADYRGPYAREFYEILDRTAFAGRRPPRLLGLAPVLKSLSRRIPYPPTVWRLVKETVASTLAPRWGER